MSLPSHFLPRRAGVLCDTPGSPQNPAALLPKMLRFCRLVVELLPPQEGTTMSECITVRGFAGTDIRTITTEKGLPIATFRLASTPRRYDRASGEWVNGETNWFNVTCFRNLALNVHSTVSKGDPVIVTGRLKIRPWENDSGQRGTAVEIDAEGLGHDLTFGTGSFTRLNPSASSPGQAEPAQEETEGSGEHEAPADEPAWDAPGQQRESPF